MRIIFAGTPDFAAGALAALVKDGHEIPAVITMPDKPKGRKKQLMPPPVKVTAQELGLFVYQPLSMKSDEVYEYIAGIAPDLMVVTACGHIIPERILQIPKYGCINEHASILPAYRGAAPIQWALMDGCRTTGVTIMQMNKGLDTGDIISVKEVEIAPDETCGSLFDKLAKTGADLLVETIREIEKGSITKTPQPEKSTTPYARMIKKSDGRIDWNKKAEELERLVRAMDPWPGAFTSLDGRILRIWKTQCCDAPGGEPGSVTCLKDGAVVQTGEGGLRLKEIQMEGKKRMECADFLRGCRIESGMKLE